MPRPSGENGTGRRDSAAVTTAIGADRDAHGCIGSAGYVWSQVREECIRPFEAGIRMAPAAEPDATTAAYIVFAEDSSRQKTEILDRRTLPGGGSAWNVEDDDTKNVRLANGRWIIEQRGKTLYEQYEAPITALFEGTDGKSRRRFRVEVRFSAGRAEVTPDRQRIRIRQRHSRLPRQGNACDAQDARRPDPLARTSRNPLIRPPGISTSMRRTT